MGLGEHRGSSRDAVETQRDDTASSRGVVEEETNEDGLPVGRLVSTEIKRGSLKRKDNWIYYLLDYVEKTYVYPKKEQFFLSYRQLMTKIKEKIWFQKKELYFEVRLNWRKHYSV